MPKIRQFAVEMALGGRSRDIWERRPPPRPPRLESRTERSFPHSHSDGRCRVKTDGMQKPAKTMSSYRFSCRTEFIRALKCHVLFYMMHPGNTRTVSIKQST